MNNIIKFALLVSIVVISGCSTPDNGNNTEPDRGTIPNVDDVIMPPSLTNEWGNTNLIYFKKIYFDEENIIGAI